MICSNCGKGLSYGHAVSHAKNRVRRTFKPNIQKLKVMRDGEEVRVKLCSDCIQRLKRDGRFGGLTSISYERKNLEVKKAMENMPKVEVPLKESTPSDKKKETIAIEDIVGKA